MDLYKAETILSNGMSYRACITENYYNQLVNTGLAYRCRAENKELVEIPTGNFRRVEQ